MHQNEVFWSPIGPRNSGVNLTPEHVLDRVSRVTPLTNSAIYGTIKVVRLKTVEEFEEWLDSLKTKTHAQVLARLQRIEEHDHFGDAKILGEDLAELRWKNGMRVYFTYTIDSQGRLVLLLLGGQKNAQKKDIKKARKLIEKYVAQED